MENTITCPHCFNGINITTVSKLKHIYLEGYCMGKDKKAYSPRERFIINSNEIVQRVNFLFDNWSNISYVMVYSEDNKYINTINHRFASEVNDEVKE